jgi:DNA-binding FadR family transcriptional regulator
LTDIELRRVKKAYEQVADQLRELILAGRLKPGVRLPPEQQLAAELRASRATIREALRILSTEGLVRSAKGAGGGTYVMHPTVEDISSFLRTNIGLLVRSKEVSLDEFLEAREIFEVPAARIAATRRRPEDVARLRATLSSSVDGPSDEQFVANRDFHATIVDVCSNALLTMAAHPVFIVLQTHLVRTTLDAGFHETIRSHHASIADVIDQGDGDRAAQLMAEHLAWLRPIYERTWADLADSE